MYSTEAFVKTIVSQLNKGHTYLITKLLLGNNVLDDVSIK